MVQLLLTVLLIALLADGIKLVIESAGRVYSRAGTPDRNKVTAVVAAYNEPNILETIEDLSKIARHIVIIDDASTDHTLDYIWTLATGRVNETSFEGDLTDEEGYVKSFFEDKDCKYTVVANHQNKGKVACLHQGLEQVNTDYVFICDADIYLSDSFTLPVSLLKDEGTDAICFSVLPAEPEKGIINKLLYKLQYHEYMKSMQIGRRFADKSKSIECVSGAAGLFKTSRLNMLSKKHSGVWQGEDLERTLLELYHDGSVVFSDQVIYTDTPQTIWELTKQRVTGWWGGLVRLLPLFGRLIVKKGSSARLRFEGIYNIISMALDPIKFITLWGLFLTGGWFVLSCLYGVYALLELYVYRRCQYRSSNAHNLPLWPILLYPVYGLLQLHYRVAAYIYMAWRKLSGQLKPLRYMMLVLFMGIASVGLSQDKVTIDGSMSSVSFNGQVEPAYNLYIGAGKIYNRYHKGLYKQANLGVYAGNFRIDLGLRTHSATPTVVYSKWMGNNVLRGKVRYNYLFSDDLKPQYKNSTLASITWARYRDGNSQSIEILKEFDREKSWIAVGKFTKKVVDNLSVTTLASVTDQQDYSLYTKVQAFWFYGYGSYKENYDYTGHTFTSVGFGVQLNITE